MGRTKPIRNIGAWGDGTGKQVSRFIFAGLGAVGVDSASYFLLVAIPIDFTIAKGISFLLGTVFAFIVNKYWTFESKGRSFSEAASFVLLYLSTLGLNMFVNHAALTRVGASTAIAFVAATGASTITNFIGQKYWVFRFSKGLSQ